MRKLKKSRDSCDLSLYNIIKVVMVLLLVAIVLQALYFMNKLPSVHISPHILMNNKRADPIQKGSAQVEPNIKANEREQKPKSDGKNEAQAAVPDVPVAGGDHGAQSHLESTALSKAIFYSSKDCSGEVTHAVYSNVTAKFCKNCYDMCGKKFNNGQDVHRDARSMRVEGVHEVNVHQQCGGEFQYAENLYVFTIFPFDGCVRLWHQHQITHIKFAPDSTQLDQPSAMLGHGDYRIVYSAESSKYMGYQARCNYWGFLQSKQKNAAHTRLVTMHEEDDLVGEISSFWAKRHPFSRRYGPMNKPDVLVKWFRSPNAPKEEVVVLIDPDNWLVKDISHVVKDVKKGHAVAQTAWFGGSQQVMQLYKEMCTVCNDFVDYVAVPIFIHKDDLAAIAPLWRDFLIRIKTRVDEDPAFKRKYNGIQIDWGGEMHAYIFAAAELGIRHETRHGLQIRDVDGTPSADRAKDIPMIHMGRAWMPKTYEPAQRWAHTEGRSWNYRGIQVWCKCNVTAADIDIWPIPDNLDFVSNITLRYLHDSQSLFPLKPSKFRSTNYHVSYP